MPYQYTPTEKMNFSRKDMRISFLSIFSSLTQNTVIDTEHIQPIVDLALNITEQLYENYPDVQEPENGEPIIDMPA